MLSSPKKSRILRQMRRFKNADFSHPENVIPCYQEILSNLKCLIWVRSDGEKIQPSLRERIQLAFDHPELVRRFGCLFLGESGSIDGGWFETIGESLLYPIGLTMWGQEIPDILGIGFRKWIDYHLLI